MSCKLDYLRDNRIVIALLFLLVEALTCTYSGLTASGELEIDRDRV